MTASWTVYFCITYNEETRYSGDKLSGVFSLLFTAKNTVDESKTQYCHVILKALVTALD